MYSIHAFLGIRAYLSREDWPDKRLPLEFLNLNGSTSLLKLTKKKNLFKMETLPANG